MKRVFKEEFGDGKGRRGGNKKRERGVNVGSRLFEIKQAVGCPVRMIFFFFFFHLNLISLSRFGGEAGRSSALVPEVQFDFSRGGERQNRSCWRLRKSGKQWRQRVCLPRVIP